MNKCRLLEIIVITKNKFYFFTRPVVFWRRMKLWRTWTLVVTRFPTSEASHSLKPSVCMNDLTLPTIKV